LTVEANDPEVERLLECLDANVGNTAGYKVFLLERAVQWLRPAFTLSGSYSLANASIVVEHPNTLSEGNRPDAVEWAQKVTSVLQGTDTHTARAALKIADILNESRFSWEAAEAVARLQRGVSDAAQTTSEREPVVA
jgi:hypothetical protein